MVDADVVVVGAGPAGAAAAIHLRRAGLSVVLVDKRRFPRDKVCGDFVGAAAIAELDDLGVTAMPAFDGVNRVRRAALHLDGRFLVERDLPPVPGLHRWAAVIPRRQLDAWLVEAAAAAGADLREGMRALRYDEGPAGVSVTLAGAGGETSVSARYLVGADGSSSDVARQLRGAPVPRPDRAVAVRAYLEGVEGPDARADLFFGHASFPGYAWLFPTGAGTANVGVGMLLETVPRERDNLQDLLARQMREDRALRSRLNGARVVGRVAGWPLATFNPRVPLVSDRVLLAGDAAALINSVNGEGIQYALMSGRWAAAAIAAAADAQGHGPGLDQYRRTVLAAMRLEMTLARFCAQFIRNRRAAPWGLALIDVIARRSRLDPEYADTAGGYLCGMVSAREFMSARMLRATATEGLRSAGRGLQAGVRRRARTNPVSDTVEIARGQPRSAGTARPAEHIAWLGDLVRAGADLAAARARDRSERR